MKLHPDDPRLTAWLLGELRPEEAAAVATVVAGDPALRLAVRELQDVQQLLTGTLSPGSQTLLPDQHTNILMAARSAHEQGEIIAFKPQRKPLKTYWMPLAAAAILMLAMLVFTLMPNNGKPGANNPPASRPDDIPLEVALLPAPGPPDSNSSEKSPGVHPPKSSKLMKLEKANTTAYNQKGDLFLRKVAQRLTESPVPLEKDLPQLRPRGHVLALDQPCLDLPVYAGVSSYIWITRTIREDHKRPPANAVRLEEILNRFALRPTGPAAVAQGVTISTETTTCPWKPSSTLLLVSFRGANDADCNVSAHFKANPDNIRKYRLLGFSPMSDLDPTPLPTRLSAKAITSLVIELEPSTPAEDLGCIEWTVNGKPAPALVLTRKSDAEPSDDARFATLVCTYAQWLADQPAGVIDAEMLAALARENASNTLPEDRADFLILIDQSINL